MIGEATHRQKEQRQCEWLSLIPAASVPGGSGGKKERLLCPQVLRGGDLQSSWAGRRQNLTAEPVQRERRPLEAGGTANEMGCLLLCYFCSVSKHWSC